MGLELLFEIIPPWIFCVSFGLFLGVVVGVLVAFVVWLVRESEKVANGP